MDPRIIKLIISACPELICRPYREGETAVHTLCRNETLQDNIAVEILSLLIEKDPTSLKIMGAWPEEMLPIHVAAEEGVQNIYSRYFTTQIRSQLGLVV